MVVGSKGKRTIASNSPQPVLGVNTFETVSDATTHRWRQPGEEG